MITNCQPDEERLAPLRECLETYGEEGNDETAEWPWNCLSRKTIAYSCGALRRGTEPAVHNHDEAEFALCRHLADEAAQIMDGMEVGMGSEASEGFAPFFIVASVGANNPQTLDAETIRAVFGGTIYPDANITVEPIAEQGEWWDAIGIDGSGEDEAEEDDKDEDEDEIDGEEDTEEATDRDESLRPWLSLIQWFQTQPAFKERMFVSIGDETVNDENGASVFPRLAVGLTHAGSIAGIAGYVVYT